MNLHGGKGLKDGEEEEALLLLPNPFAFQKDQLAKLNIACKCYVLSSFTILYSLLYKTTFRFDKGKFKNIFKCHLHASLTV
jgi:hypothetical protein